MLTDEEVLELLSEQLPRILQQRPQLEPLVYRAFVRTFVTKEELGGLRERLDKIAAEMATKKDLEALRAETKEEFATIRAEMATKADLEALRLNLTRAIDRLGARWGIRNESVFRQTIQSLLTQSFGVQVQRTLHAGEEFDVVVRDGEHILIEIAASVGPRIQQRLVRKRTLYREVTGVEPARFILATGSIHSHRVEALRGAGFEVLEPEEATYEET